MFTKSFPINSEKSSSLDVKSVDLKDYTDTVSITDMFNFKFENSGFMKDGVVFTAKTKPVLEKPISLFQIRDENSDLSKYHLCEKQIEKMQYFKNSKRINRVKPNGESYVYSEGGMKFPDSLDLPGRTILTSEASINRSTHVIEDKSTGKLRFITPIEAERLQCFPDDWTNTGMPESRRYFMMGNALVTKIVNRLEPELKKIIENEQ